MGFGLSISLLSFSKSSALLKRQKISMYRDIQTLELLTSLVVVCLRKEFKFESKQIPTMYNIGIYLGEIYSLYTPAYTHNIYKRFFSHFFHTDNDVEYDGIVNLVRFNDQFYVTSGLYPIAPEILTTFTEDELPLFFDYFKIDSFMSFSWQLEHPWVYSLGKHVIKSDDKDVLVLAHLSDDGEFPVRRSLFNFYTLLLETFKTFPFTSDEANSKQIIYNYIITMKEFLEMKPE